VTSGSITIDPRDFDSVGHMAEVVVSLRGYAMERQSDAVAAVSAPPGRHQLKVTARRGGHAVLSVRFDELTVSRRNVIAEALARRGWDFDTDGEGATRRFPPGTDHTTVAFEALAVLTLGGTAPVARVVDARDSAGAPLPLPYSPGS